MGMDIQYLMARNMKYASNPFWFVLRHRIGLVGWRLLRDKFPFYLRGDLSNSPKHPRIRRK